MLKLRQRGAIASSYSFGLRAVALACLLLFGLASSVQTVHIHGDWLPDGAAKVAVPSDASQLPGGEEHCPLCVGMHSALPVGERTVAEPLVVLDAVFTADAVPAPDATWHFALYSRPPPVLTLA